MEKGCPFEQRIHEIRAVVKSSVSVETMSHDYEELVQEGRYYSSLSPNVVLKVSMYKDGTCLRIVSKLASEGIQTNVTTLMTAGQALLAARRGNLHFGCSGPGFDKLRAAGIATRGFERPGRGWI